MKKYDGLLHASSSGETVMLFEKSSCGDTLDKGTHTSFPDPFCVRSIFFWV